MKLIRQCCVCKQVEHEGEWLDPIYDLLWHLKNNKNITHTFCPDCYAKKMKEVAIVKKELNMVK